MYLTPSRSPRLVLPVRWEDIMNRTLIAKSATLMVRDLVERANNLRHLRKSGRLHQGELKELFVGAVLKRFLPNQLGQPDSESGQHNYAEAARFIALFVDNARTKAEQRFRILVSRHVDLVTMYIRE
ncbi:MAG: hypothetical protein A2Z25_22850 [Planctomycetes bacterium RBG_16_55_9]|nr:MAG: hypothetical protein A2Z25_22850 [Planctomycetes bacterium RBG_16_55_9]